VRFCKADDANHQRGVGQPVFLDIDVGCRGLRIFSARTPSAMTSTGADAGVAFEHNEAPGCQLAVIGHPRARWSKWFSARQSEDPASAHLPRLYRAANFQQFDASARADFFMGNIYHGDMAANEMLRMEFRLIVEVEDSPSCPALPPSLKLRAA